MRQLFILLFVGLFYSLPVLSQKSGKVTYMKKLKVEDTLFNALKESNPKQYQSYRKAAKEMRETMERFSFTLCFKDREAIYEQDDILIKNLKYESLKNMEGVNYTNLNTQESIEQQNISGFYFLIRKPKFDWNILKDIKVISGFSSRKATTTLEVYDYKLKTNIIKEVTAWFTTEISVPFGPKGYYGLPGLITQLQIGSTIYYISDLDLSPLKEKIKKPKRGKEVTEKEFKKIMHEMNQKFLEFNGN